MEKSEFGKFIKDERTKQKLSQSALAERAGISRRQAIMEVENDLADYSSSVLIKLIDALGYKLQPVKDVPEYVFPHTLEEGYQTSFDFRKVESAIPDDETLEDITFQISKNRHEKITHTDLDLPW